MQQLKEAKEQLRQKLAVLQERDEEHTQSLKVGFSHWFRFGLWLEAHHS